MGELLRPTMARERGTSTKYRIAFLAALLSACLFVFVSLDMNESTKDGTETLLETLLSLVPHDEQSLSVEGAGTKGSVSTAKSDLGLRDDLRVLTDDLAKGLASVGAEDGEKKGEVTGKGEGSFLLKMGLADTGAIVSKSPSTARSAHGHERAAFYTRKLTQARTRTQALRQAREQSLEDDEWGDVPVSVPGKLDPLPQDDDIPVEEPGELKPLEITPVDWAFEPFVVPEQEAGDEAAKEDVVQEEQALEKEQEEAVKDKKFEKAETIKAVKQIVEKLEQNYTKANAEVAVAELTAQEIPLVKDEKFDSAAVVQEAKKKIEESVRIVISVGEEAARSNSSFNLSAVVPIQPPAPCPSYPPPNWSPPANFTPPPTWVYPPAQYNTHYPNTAPAQYPPPAIPQSYYYPQYVYTDPRAGQVGTSPTPPMYYGPSDGTPVDGWLMSPDGRRWLDSTYGANWLNNMEGWVWLESDNGRQWLATPNGGRWLSTDAGKFFLSRHTVVNQQAPSPPVQAPPSKGEDMDVPALKRLRDEIDKLLGSRQSSAAVQPQVSPQNAYYPNDANGGQYPSYRPSSSPYPNAYGPNVPGPWNQDSQGTPNTYERPWAGGYPSPGSRPWAGGYPSPGYSARDSQGNNVFGGGEAGRFAGPNAGGGSYPGAYAGGGGAGGKYGSGAGAQPQAYDRGLGGVGNYDEYDLGDTVAKVHRQASEAAETMHQLRDTMERLRTAVHQIEDGVSRVKSRSTGRGVWGDSAREVDAIARGALSDANSDQAKSGVWLDNAIDNTEDALKSLEEKDSTRQTDTTSHALSSMKQQPDEPRPMKHQDSKDVNIFG